MTGPASSASGPPPLAHAEPAMGTVFSFAVVTGAQPEAALRAAIAGACEILHRYDALFSTWDGASPVSRYRRGEVTLSQMPPEFHQVAEECRAAKRASGGWFDPWAMPGGFDPTGLVKGWATERALDVLRDCGVPGALINGGGDVAAFGSPASGQRWRVGIRHPWRPNALAGIVETAAAVATSGCYERGQHLIDPRTGQPASRAASATVTGPSLTLADALATGIAVGGDEALSAVSRLTGYAAYLIRADGSETSTGGIEFVRLSASLAGTRPGACGASARPQIDTGGLTRLRPRPLRRNDGAPHMVEGYRNHQAPRKAASVQRGSRPQMTVQHEAATQGVILTSAAATKVSNLLAQEGRDDLKLRIAVQPGGCSGLRYQLYFDEREIDGDIDAEFGGVHVVTDKMSAPYLTGATIDFVDTIEKQGFTIDNPNATGSCACGDSFH